MKVGLQDGCVMSPWLFDLFIVGVVKEMKVRVLKKGPVTT